MTARRPHAPENTGRPDADGSAGRLVADLDRVFREESGRAVATLVRFLGDIDLAAEAVQEAFATALENWPRTGVPRNPGAWITTTARNRAIDRLRREASRAEKHAQAAVIHPWRPPEPEGPVSDDRLRLIFTCCHPALAPASQVALTLRLLCGLQTDQIARAFLVGEAAMAQRLTRTKQKIKAARIPYRVPDDAQLPERLPPVLAAVYLTYTEGHTATSGDDLVRAELCTEAIRLARLLHELMPDEPEVTGLLALLLLIESRRPARTDDDGSVILLADQDRRRWDRTLIAEGQDQVRACLRRNAPGPYQLQAAINAVHADTVVLVPDGNGSGARRTDWAQILALYDRLLTVTPTPVVALNRAVALAEVAGPQAALDAVQDLKLRTYQPFHVTRAELLTRLGRSAEAAEAYRRALDLTGNAAEHRLLSARLAAAVAAGQ